jgi:hypothetical protein
MWLVVPKGHGLHSCKRPPLENVPAGHKLQVLPLLLLVAGAVLLMPWPAWHTHSAVEAISRPLGACVPAGPAVSQRKQVCFQGMIVLQSLPPELRMLFTHCES